MYNYPLHPVSKSYVAAMTLWGDEKSIVHLHHFISHRVRNFGPTTLPEEKRRRQAQFHQGKMQPDTRARTSSKGHVCCLLLNGHLGFFHEAKTIKTREPDQIVLEQTGDRNDLPKRVLKNSWISVIGICLCAHLHTNWDMVTIDSETLAWYYPRQSTWSSSIQS